MSFTIHCRRAQVNDHRSLLYDLPQFSGAQWICQTIEDIIRIIPCHIQRSLGRTKGRRIGKLNVNQIINCPAKLQYSRHGINALIHAAFSDSLSAQHLPVLQAENHLQGKDLSPGVIGHMGCGIGQSIAVILAIHEPFPFQSPFILARGGCRKAKDLQDGTSYHAFVLSFSAGNIVSGQPCLPIGWACQSQSSFLPGLMVKGHHGITYGIYAFCTGLHVLIDQNMPSFTNTDAAVRQEGRIWPYANGQYHKISWQRCPISQMYFQFIIIYRDKLLHAAAKEQIDSILTQFFFCQHNHIIIKRREYMRHRFHQCDIHAPLPEILRRLHADKSATNYHSFALGITLSQLAHSICIRHIPKRHDMRMVNAGNRRTQRLGTGRKHQCIIIFCVFLLSGLDGDYLLLRIYADNLALDTHIHVE